MNVARYLVQGVDVWLNTPRRPYEASGTSGMKAAANGVLNCSILDGWWVEGYAPDVGWAIGRGENYTDAGYQDHVESQALYDILEKQIIPLFYHRGVDNIPREWIARMKNCMRKLAPVFNTNRMVRDYAEKFYIPAFDRGAAARPPTACQRAIALAHAKDVAAPPLGRHPDRRRPHQRQRPLQGRREHAGRSAGRPARRRSRRPDRAALRRPDQRQGEIEQPQALAMEHAKALAPDRHVFVGKIDCRTSGRQGFAIRILPGTADLATPFEPGLIIWN